MHASIQFHVDVQRNGNPGNSQGTLNKLQIAETKHLWLQMVFDDIVVTIDLRTHHHDRQIDARTAQLHTLIGKSYRQIIGTMKLEDIRYFVVAAAVPKRLHHDHQLGLRLNQ